MTDADMPAFARAMAGLSVAFGEEITTERGRLYFEALRDLSIEQVRAGIAGAIRSCRFFPKPVEIRAGVEASTPDVGALVAALTAWKRTHWTAPALPSDAPPLLRALVARLGGWQTVLDLSERDTWFRVQKLVEPLVQSVQAEGDSLALDGPTAPRIEASGPRVYRGLEREAFDVPALVGGKA